jgi:uncharacterized protein YkwD
MRASVASVSKFVTCVDIKNKTNAETATLGNFRPATETDVKILPYFVLCFLAASIVTGCESPSLPAALPVRTVDLDAGLPELENRIFVLVEESRGRRRPDAAPLALDPELTEVARLRSQRMASASSFADADGNPHVAASLLMARNPTFQGRLGENVAARHFASEDGIDVEAIAKGFVDEWLQSPPHLENLLFTAYNHGGVGVAANRDTIYATLLFSVEIPQGIKAEGASRSQGPKVAIPPGGQDDTGASPLGGGVVP